MESLEETIISRRDKINAQIIGKALEDHRLNLINRECLLDALQALYDECNIENLQKYDKHIAQFVERYKNTIKELKRLRVNITDFEIKDVIGRGHFGEVHVVKEKQTGDIYAMKSIRKCDSLDKTSFDVERDIMAFSHSPWITSLQYSFQDATFLFFIMEYHPGGDLLGLLYRQGGTLPESAATFYLAELVLALEDLHSMGYVHRDIKPDNILLDRCGHLKLVDFGSAAKINSEGFVEKGIPVGTPDYVAPEVLQSVESKNTKHSGYGVSCDFWSLGILAYELVVGKAPFNGHNSTTVYSKIMNHTNNLKFPSDVLLTQAYVSFIKGLIVDAKSRLNQKQIKQHVLFKNVHFDSLRDQVPPYVPKIVSVDDTSNFVDITPTKPGPNVENFKKKTQFSGRNLPFIGFTYTHGFTSCDKSFSRNSSVAKDEIIKNIKAELEDTKRILMKHEGIEELKLTLERKIAEKNQKLENIENVRNKLERDLAGSIAEATALRRTLEIERKDRTELEKKALDLIKSAKIKWETSERNKIESLKLEIQQQKEKIIQLSTTNNMLNEQLQRAFKLEDKHKISLEAVEQLNRRSVVGLESRLEKVAQETNNQITNLQKSLDEANQQKQILEAKLKKYKDNEKIILKELEASKREYSSLNSKTLETEKLVNQLSQKVGELETESEKSEYLETKISELTQKINFYQENIKNLEKKHSALQLENETITEKYINEINDLKTVKSQNEKKINELESNLHEEKEKCDSLKKQLEDSESLINEGQQLKELRLKFWKMEKDLGNCKIDKRIIERELKEAENQIKKLNEEIVGLNKKIDENKKKHESAMLEMSSINENLSLELIKCKESCTNLEDKLESEQRIYVEDKIVITELKDTIKNKDQTISELNSKLECCKNEMSSLKEQCQFLDNKKQQIIGDLNDAKKENQRLIREIEDIQRQRENTQMNLEALREACVLIENQVIEYENLNAKIQAEKTSLTENTEKLIKDLCKAKEDIQAAKKLANEEKSARLLSETKVKRLNEEIDCLKKECSSYKDQCLKYRECSSNLSDELTVSEEKVSDLEVTVRSYERQIEGFVSENNILKEEVSQYLTQISAMKESNFKLKQHVHELKDTRDILVQKIDELESTLNAKINYYEERELKNDSTIKQQTKLIDYLQVKIDEHNQKKKTFADKLFGHSKKENQTPLTIPINYKDLEGQLQKQKQINRELQEEIYKLKAELNCKANSDIMNKIEKHKSEIVSPKTKRAMEQLVKSPVSSKSELFRQHSVQRMHHNIPHRFVSKLCKKMTKCDHCANQIVIGREMNVCSECNVYVHLDCSNSLKGTCGLPRAYAEHFRDSLTRLNSSNNQVRERDASVNTEGWIKILRKDDVWEKRYACLTDFHLNTYTNLPKENGSLLESFELKLPNSRGHVVLEPLPSEIGVNVAASDLPFIIKIEVCVNSTCWPPVSIVFMTLSIPDRDNWYKALQKLFTNDDVSKYHIETILTVPNHLYINCILELTKNIKVLGTNQGLHSYYNDLLLHIEGLSEIHYICIVPETNIVVMISGSKSLLFSCDLNHLINLTQCAPCTKPVLTYKNISMKNLEGFHFLQAASNDTKHQMFCAATSKQLVIAKYDLDNNDFIPLRIMDTAEPIGCILFTDHTLIVGADKFFEIDLATFKAEEFLDSSDLNLKHAVKCYKMRSFPLAIMQISENPKEYLLCFNEFAVFVDEYGRCSRTKTEIKSSYLPIGFQFIKPYLYIVQFGGVEILKLAANDANDVSVPPNVIIELKKMKYVGHNKTGIYVWHEGRIKLLEGKKLVDSDDASSVQTTSTDNEEESDRFSFTSSMVQSLDGNLSDTETVNSVEAESNRKVRFSKTNL